MTCTKTEKTQTKNQKENLTVKESLDILKTKFKEIDQNKKGNQPWKLQRSKQTVAAKNTAWTPT